MNLNKGCIEILISPYEAEILNRMNLNKGCIEM